MSNILELAKKLKALADRGVDGEKLNAEAMLQKLMKKHNISADELETDTIDTEFININRNFEFLTMILIQSVIGEVQFYEIRKKGKRILNKIGFKCKKHELIEIQAKIDFYIKAFKAELEIFEVAFLGKNNIRPKFFNPENDHLRQNLDMETYLKIKSMQNGIDSHQFHKQIEQ